MKKILVPLCLYFILALDSTAHAELLGVRIINYPQAQDEIVQLILTDDEKGVSFNINSKLIDIDFNLLIDWEKVIVRLITTSQEICSFTVDRTGIDQLFIVLNHGNGNFQVVPDKRVKKQIVNKKPKIYKWNPPNVINISNKSLVQMDEIVSD